MPRQTWRVKQFDTGDQIEKYTNALFSVMAGLDPAIHAHLGPRRRVDHRVKPGDDEKKYYSICVICG